MSHYVVRIMLQVGDEFQLATVSHPAFWEVLMFRDLLNDTQLPVGSIFTGAVVEAA